MNYNYKIFEIGGNCIDLNYVIAIHKPYKTEKNKYRIVVDLINGNKVFEDFSGLEESITFHKKIVAYCRTPNGIKPFMGGVHRTTNNDGSVKLLYIPPEWERWDEWYREKKEVKQNI